MLWQNAAMACGHTGNCSILPQQCSPPSTSGGITAVHWDTRSAGKRDSIARVLIVVIPDGFTSTVTLALSNETFAEFHLVIRGLIGLPPSQRFSERCAAQKAKLSIHLWCFPLKSPFLDPATWLAVDWYRPRGVMAIGHTYLAFAWVSGSVAPHCTTRSILLDNV